MRPHLLAILLVGATFLFGAVAGHPVPVVEAACQGTAPFVMSCTTGSHPFLGLPPTLGCGFEPSYVGSVVSVLDHAQGFGAVRCTRHADGTVEGDSWGGGSAPPGLLDPMQHDCFSFEPGTFTPGGVGRFTCTLSH